MNNERIIYGIASWQEARDEIIMHVYILSIAQLLACSLITSWLARIAFFIVSGLDLEFSKIETLRQNIIPLFKLFSTWNIIF
jgi:hypothetical protein